MNTKLFILALTSTLFLFQSNVTFSQDVPPEEDTDGNKFYDRGLLIDTLTADDSEDVDNAQVQLDLLNDELMAVEDDLLEANDSGTATEEEIMALEDKISMLNDEVDQSETDVEEAEMNADTELTAITEQVDQLSDDQVRGLNQQLNNVVVKGVTVDIDSEDLQMVLDGDYNFQQINAFTKAFEEEAKFNRHAKKFEEKSEEEGGEKFLDQVDKMIERSDSQKEKFLAKIDGFEGKGAPGTDALTSAQQITASDLKVDGKSESKVLAKSTAQNEIRLAAKAVAEAAKSDARSESRELAVQALKEEAKSKATIN
jgi:hypothetical protein